MERTAPQVETADEQLRRMVESYGDSVLRMCCLHLGDRTLAEDAAQDTFCKAYTGLRSFRGNSSEKTWLMRIAINVCRDYRRRAWFWRVDRRVPVEDMILTDPTTPEAEDHSVLREVMRLPAKDREVLLLRYYQEMSIAEISKALGAPKGTVTSRLNRARARLRPRLERWYFGEDL